MGKSIWDYVAPVLGTIGGSLIGNPELGLLGSLGTAAGGAIGAGVGSGLSTGIQTGNPLSGLVSGVASGAGSFAGGQLLGPTLNGLGGGVNALSGAAAPGALGTPIASSLSQLGGDAAKDVLGSATFGDVLGGAAGSGIAQGIAGQVDPNINKTNTPNPPGPSLQAPSGIPQSLNSLSGYTPQQQASNIATQGVYGGGNGPGETNYFLNLMNRQLFDQPNNSSLSPVENNYLQQLGIKGNDPNSLLQGIQNYQP